MSTNQAITIIQRIICQIANNDTQALSDNLAKLPLGTISRDKAETLLALFLNQATKNSNIEAARLIISTFDITRIRVDPLPALTNLILNPELSREVVFFSMACFPEKIPIDYFVDLINMGDDQSALKAAVNLATFFPDISHEDWDKLFHLTDNVEEEEYENQLLRAFFRTKAAETGINPKPPSWICLDLPEPVIETIPDSIPSVKEAVELILEDLGKNKINIISSDIETKEFLISQYSISSIIEKIQMLANIKEIPMFNDIPLFREFGPVNTIYTSNPNLVESTHQCVKYGGCRMLLCTEFEDMYSDGEEIDIMAIDYTINDWFRGSCDKCLQKIGKRHYAVRQPLRHGGWKGCYCSFECMKSNINDPHTALMVGRIKEQLSIIGIRDR